MERSVYRIGAWNEEFTGDEPGGYKGEEHGTPCLIERNMGRRVYRRGTWNAGCIGEKHVTQFCTVYSI